MMVITVGYTHGSNKDKTLLHKSPNIPTIPNHRLHPRGMSRLVTNTCTFNKAKPKIISCHVPNVSVTSPFFYSNGVIPVP